MSRTFRMIQVNVRKHEVVQSSLVNNEEIRDATVLANQEPPGAENPGTVLDNPYWAPQVGQDGSIGLERGQMGDPEHALR